MRRALVVAAIAEIATGLGLVFAPTLVGELLLGADLTGLVATVARVAGLALIGLGATCWPGPPSVGMLIYGATVAVYLAFLGVAGEAAGILLWPAVAIHAVLSVCIALSWAKDR